MRERRNKTQSNSERRIWGRPSRYSNNRALVVEQTVFQWKGIGIRASGPSKRARVGHLIGSVALSRGLHERNG